MPSIFMPEQRAVGAAARNRKFNMSYAKLHRLFAERPVVPMLTPHHQVIRLLHLEDGLTERFFVREMLRRRPGQNTVFQITHVRRMFDALTALEHHPFDIILADLQLPDTDGLETIMALRAATPDIPIIVHSGIADTNLLKDTKLCGVFRCVMKGQEDIDTFHTILRDALYHRPQPQPPIAGGRHG